jgi:GATA zinc finger
VLSHPPFHSLCPSPVEEATRGIATCARRPSMSDAGAPRALKREAKEQRSCDQCGVTRTPNWRKGWELADGGFANLCNACGIRCVSPRAAVHTQLEVM